MKLSEETLSILKNFSGMNQSIYVKQGSKLRTISAQDTIRAEATVAENFDKDFALFDLNKLLGKMSLYKDAHLELHDDHLLIMNEDGSRQDRIIYCSPKAITIPDDRTLSLGNTVWKFVLSRADLSWMRKSASISDSKSFIFESDGTSINFIATNIDDSSSDRSSVKIGAGNGEEFRVVVKVENLKIIDGTYEVSLAKNRFARFKNVELDLTYDIAIESTSSKG